MNRDASRSAPEPAPEGAPEGAPAAAAAPGVDPDAVAFDARGLTPVVVQDARSGEVLTLAYADREALERTLASGEAHFFSRSRGELWHKGATSGNTQRVVEVRLDCDADALLYRVEPRGPACHTGERSCFHRTVAPTGEATAASPIPGTAPHGYGEVLALLERVVAERLRELPEGSYVTSLHRRGLGYVAQKVVEEAGESVVAALQHHDDELVGEAADLLFHLAVLLAERGVELRRVTEELASRHAERRRDPR